MIGIIAALTVNGIIGIENELPFDYPCDLKHFKKLTLNSNIIMGRKTADGIGRALPKRNNIVISSRPLEIAGITRAVSIAEAISAISKNDHPTFENTWFIGGASIYEEGMEYADKIVLTLTPDYERRQPAVKFPWINVTKFKIDSILPLCPEDSFCNLQVATYLKYKD